jgi:hypothetical protein
MQKSIHSDGNAAGDEVRGHIQYPFLSSDELFLNSGRK